MNDIDDYQNLIHLIKKNPESYHEEIDISFIKLKYLIDLIKMENSFQDGFNIKLPSNFRHLLNFISNVVKSKIIKTNNNNLIYNNNNKIFDSLLSTLDHKNFNKLSNENKETIIKSIMIANNNKIIDNFITIKKLFLFLEKSEKSTRNIIFKHIVKTISINRKHCVSNGKNSLLKFFSQQIDKPSPILSKNAINILSELYRRNIWRTSKVAQILSNGIFSQNGSVLRRTAKFLLGERVGDLDEDIIEEKIKECNGVMHQLNKGKKVGRKSAKRSKKLNRLTKQIKKSKKELKNVENNPTNVDFSAIRSLYDPITFVQKTFKSLKTCRENFMTKILLMRLISRVISCHELVLIGFYSFLQRYMQPHQDNVTKILAYLVQACHSKIPLVAIKPSIKLLTNNFITDRSNDEIITVGLNTIREICARVPKVMEDECDLLRDLTKYKKSKCKSIASAARGLITLYRIENPKLLMKYDRGRPLKNDDDDTNKMKIQNDSEDDKITPEFPVKENELLGDVILRQREVQKLKDNRIENKNKNKNNKFINKKTFGRTNEDKKRNKNFKLTKHNKKVKKRTILSLREKRKKIDKHNKRIKGSKRRKFRKKTR